jgi:hypothetical protein
MGYTTLFHGDFTISPPLEPRHRVFLCAFSETRRCQRLPKAESESSEKLRQEVKLPFGDRGEHCVGEVSSAFDKIINYDEPPGQQPGLWCNWVPLRDGHALGWNGAEKFYHYEEWLGYLLNTYLIPWGYEVSGSVCWSGEDMEDFGWLRVHGNQVEASAFNREWG